MSAIIGVFKRALTFPKNCSKSVNYISFVGSRGVHGSRPQRCTSQVESEASHEQSREDREEEVREAIFHAALRHVPQHGWTKKAISAGAEEVGLPGVAHGMFPRGGIDLINHLYISCNEELAQQMSAQRQAEEESAIPFRITPFIRGAVETRLRMNTPYIDQWAQAMAIMALPQNALQSWNNLSDLVDEIWHQAGDKSVDMNWYTKRTSLAAVYKSTELHMLQDRSEDYMETWDFLDRRMDNLISFSKGIKQVQQTGTIVGENMWNFCTLGRNMMGMNDRNR